VGSVLQLVLTVYSLFVLLAGMLLMGYESVQARYSLRDIAPRLLCGFLAGALSLTVARFAVDTANALATALLQGGVDPHSGAAGLRQLLTSAVTTDNGALFTLMLGFAIVVALVVVLLGYVIRVLLTVILIAGAPIALMFHALPQTEGIARWWWRTFGACLAIQVVQSLTLVTALDLLLTPGRGFSVFTEPGQGADRDQALPTMLVVLALLFILCRIPFWLLSGSRVGQGRSLVGSPCAASSPTASWACSADRPPDDHPAVATHLLQAVRAAAAVAVPVADRAAADRAAADRAAVLASAAGGRRRIPCPSGHRGGSALA
jgi:hypothetical protein